MDTEIYRQAILLGHDVLVSIEDYALLRGIAPETVCRKALRTGLKRLWNLEAQKQRYRHERRARGLKTRGRKPKGSVNDARA